MSSTVSTPSKATSESHVLSAQEEAIQSGKKTLHGGMSDRIVQMHDAVRSHGAPILQLERALLFTESFKQTEGKLCDAITLWAKRYSKLATDLAVKETNAARKKELEEIAVICDWVRENPARTFREGLQVNWFVQLWTKMEQNLGSGTQNGRMDQYLYPYHKKDGAEGRLTVESAKELLQCVWINMEQLLPSFLSKIAAATTPNGRHAQEFLFEGVSASHGADTKGLTVAFASFARARASNWGGLNGPGLMNMKFAPASVAGPEGTRRLMQIIRGWCALKLWHVQFNILDRQTLLEAQKDPEKYAILWRALRVTPRTSSTCRPCSKPRSSREPRKEPKARLHRP